MDTAVLPLKPTGTDLAYPCLLISGHCLQLSLFLVALLFWSLPMFSCNLLLSVSSHDSLIMTFDVIMAQFDVILTIYTHQDPSYRHDHNLGFRMGMKFCRTFFNSIWRQRVWSSCILPVLCVLTWPSVSWFSRKDKSANFKIYVS